MRTGVGLAWAWEPEPDIVVEVFDPQFGPPTGPMLDFDEVTVQCWLQAVPGLCKRGGAVMLHCQLL
jgi:hypothetical protein